MPKIGSGPESVLLHLANDVCSDERVEALKSLLPKKFGAEVGPAWRSLITTGGTVSRNYLFHLVEKIVVRENEIEVVAKPEFANPTEFQNKNVPL